MTKFLWFTGLSGSGKTTLARRLEDILEKKGKTVLIIDGDIIRSEDKRNLGFSIKDIEENNRHVLGLCLKAKESFDYVLVSLISPLRKIREEARSAIGEDFLEIYLNCSYEECKKRDTKGLYKRAESGQIENFIGLHIAYEPPINSEIEINSIIESPEESIRKIVEFIGEF